MFCIISTPLLSSLFPPLHEVLKAKEESPGCHTKIKLGLLFILLNEPEEFLFQALTLNHQGFFRALKTIHPSSLKCFFPM